MDQKANPTTEANNKINNVFAKVLPNVLCKIGEHNNAYELWNIVVNFNKNPLLTL